MMYITVSSDLIIDVLVYTHTHTHTHSVYLLYTSHEIPLISFLNPDETSLPDASSIIIITIS